MIDLIKDNAIQPVATSLAMDLTLIKYTLSLFLVYPLASILYAIPDKNVKHLYSFVVGQLTATLKYIAILLFE